MKVIVYIAAAAALCAGLAAFVVSLKGRGKPVESAGLAGQVEAVVAGWTAGRAGPGGGVASIVLDDTSQGDDPLSVPEGPSDGGSFMGRLRSLLGGGRPPEPSAFARAFKAAEPGAAVWSFEGFSKAEEPAMVKAVKEAVVRANEAGGQVNIVARGAAAAIALKAVKSMEGSAARPAAVGSAESPAGAGAGAGPGGFGGTTAAGDGPLLIVVNRVIVIGMNEEALRRRDPAFFDGFRRPGNLREWLNVWADRDSIPPAMPVTFHSPEAPGIRYYGPAVVNAQAIETLLGRPGSAGFAAAVAEFARAVAGLARSAGSLKSALDRATEVIREQAQAGPPARPAQAPLAEAGAQAGQGPGAAEVREFRSVLDGKVTRRPVGGGSGQDSLSMVRAGGMYGAGQADGSAAGGADAGRQGSAWGGDGVEGRSVRARTDQEAHIGLCSRCCAESGGTWRRGSYSGNCSTQAACQAKYGCCEGAGRRDTGSCSAAIFNCSDGGIRAGLPGMGGGCYTFRCAGSGAP